MNKVMNNEHQHVSEHTVTREERDVSIRGLAKFGVALVALGVVANLLVWGMFHQFNKSAQRSQSPSPPMFKGNQLPPEPRLQGAPGHQTSAPEDLREMQKREDEILGSYGWVDQPNGIVHIPIQDAKKLILKKGTASDVDNAITKPTEPGK